MVDGGWVATIEDITETIRAEARIEHMARHDALTGLANRVLFREEMEKGLVRVARGETLAVLCLDLDHFKSVNDTLGHPVGDGLLKAVTERLLACVRDTDTVARLGGDEFAILQAGVDKPESAAILAQRLIDDVCEPYDIDGHEVVVGASVGIAIAPSDGDHPDQLLKNADMALYRAKSDGRRLYRVFEREMDARLQARRALELDLRKALATGSSSCSTSRSSTCGPRPSAAARRSCAGTIPGGASCRRPSSSRLPRRSGSSCRSANGCCAKPASRRRNGRGA
jgi:diguanylate cyclase (GGDEF)-like protein